MTFTYRQFCELTGLSKKEVDTWVRSGLIKTGRHPNGRWRIYRMESVFEGFIAKRLADFSSRELLLDMMNALRGYLDTREITPADLHQRPCELLMIATRKTTKLKAGGGVRGVEPQVTPFYPSSKPGTEPVFVVIDLGATDRQIWEAIPKMSHY
jgi:hypothetical protein